MLHHSYYFTLYFTFFTLIICHFASFFCLHVSLSIFPGPVLSRRESFISRIKALLLSDCVRKVMTAAHHSLPLPCWLLIFSWILASYHIAIFTFRDSLLKHTRSKSFMTGLKKIWSQQRQQWKLWKQCITDLLHFNLNTPLNFAAEQQQHSSFMSPVHWKMPLQKLKAPREAMFLWETVISGLMHTFNRTGNLKRNVTVIQSLSNMPKSNFPLCYERQSSHPALKLLIHPALS